MRSFQIICNSFSQTVQCVYVLTNIVLLLCAFSGVLLFSLLLMLFNKPEIKLTTTTIIISLKSHNLAKSRNFRSQKLKICC